MNRVIRQYVHDTQYEVRPQLRDFIECLLPDRVFGEVMQGMVDSSWLRERAETIAATGDPDSNAKAAALFEAADAAEAASASADAAP